MMKKIEYLINRFYEISDKIGKHNVMLIAFIVVVLIITGLYSTFSLFTSSEGVEVIDGLVTYKFILDNELPDTSIIVPANSDKNLDIVVTNNEDTPLKYGIYYSSTGSVTIGYTTSTSNSVSGMIEDNSVYTISLKVSNDTSSDITVDLGLSYGFANGGDLVLPDGKSWISDIYPVKLSQVPTGSYVEYSGTNGCPEGHCDGTNANYVDDSNMGYCSNSSYKFSVNGWRVAYVKGGSAHLVSAGAPECMCTNANGTTSDNSCTGSVTVDDVDLHIDNLNNKALTYCNPKYANGGVCDNTTAWALNGNDFYNITGVAFGSDGFGLVGRTNDLIGLNGGYWWYANVSSDNTFYFWRQSDSLVFSYQSNIAYGVRPVIKLDDEVIVTGGIGTYEDPYKIKNPNISDPLASDYIISKYNDGSTITTVNIGGDTANPTVSLNATQGIMLDNNGDYRYYGADPNNYVWYNDELWRIISVGNVKSSETDTVGETRVKIVKSDILTDDNGLNEYAYDYSYLSVNGGYGVNDWSQADLMTELNTLYFNSTSGVCYTGRGNETVCNFTNTGLSAEARELTGNALYYLGGINSEDSGIVLERYADDYYTFERGTTVWGTTSGQTCSDGACPRTTTWTGRLGIIYPSDYAYATDLSVCTDDPNAYDGNENCYGKDWLLYTDYYQQWTLSPSSVTESAAFFVNYTGYVYYDYFEGVSSSKAVRPVQYLKSEVTIVDGEGTDKKPYILGT